MALWGKNLTNNHVATGGFNSPQIGVTMIYPSIPRSYDVDFVYRFF